MRARAGAPVSRRPTAPDWPPSLPAATKRRRTGARTLRRRRALAVAATAFVLAALLAVLGLVAGTRAAAHGEDLGQVSHAGFVVE